jgi:hypothetical protein
MPNWCTNRVDVVGAPEDVTAFRNAVANHDMVFSLNKIVPRPPEFDGKKDTTKARDEELRDLTTKYGAADWFTWSVQNWGTKWDVCVSTLEEFGPGEIRYTFDTAWGPPKPICELLRQRFPALSITWSYDEPGNQIAGYL